MKDGFLRVGAASPKIRVADIDFNAEQIISCVKNADKDCALLVFPELCVTGCTCGDLFRQEAFIDHAWEALYHVAEETSDAPQVFIIGLPAYIEGKLLNLAVKNSPATSLLMRSTVLSMTSILMRRSPSASRCISVITTCSLSA